MKSDYMIKGPRSGNLQAMRDFIAAHETLALSDDGVAMEVDSTKSLLTMLENAEAEAKAA